MYVNDWAAKAAKRILACPAVKSIVLKHEQEPAEACAAEIIRTYGKKLSDALRRCKKPHYHNSFAFDMCCPMCKDGDHDQPLQDAVCDCTATEWNALIDKALDGEI